MIAAAAIFVFLPVQGLASATAGSCVSSGSCGNTPVTLREVEQQELNEATALRTELMQRTARFGSLHKEVAEVTGQASAEKANLSSDMKAATSTQKGAEAVAEPVQAGTTKQQENDPISMDANGKVCMLCNKPLAERTNKEYTEFRTDCGAKSSSTGPTKAALNVAAVNLHKKNSQGEVISNGFCELNFAKSCADAVANQDYLYWPKSMDLNTSATKANAAWDARYCAMNGFLEHDIVSLQHDFLGMKQKGEELCKTKYSKYNIEKLSFMDMMAAARYDDATAPKLEEAELLAAWNCAMGDLGCDLALCAYSFCTTASGHGLYDECQGWDPVNGMPF